MYPALVLVMVAHLCEVFVHERRSFSQVSAGAPDRGPYLHLEVRMYRVVF